MNRRDPVPKIHARPLKTSLTFDARKEDEIECLRWIRKAPHGEMSRRLMSLVLEGFAARRARLRRDRADD